MLHLQTHCTTSKMFGWIVKENNNNNYYYYNCSNSDCLDCKCCSAPFSISPNALAKSGFIITVKTNSSIIKASIKCQIRIFAVRSRPFISLRQHCCHLNWRDRLIISYFYGKISPVHFIEVVLLLLELGDRLNVSFTLFW